MGQTFSEKINYCPAELSVMKDFEFIYYLDDFMRRRTILGQTVSQTELEKDSGFTRLIEYLKK